MSTICHKIEMATASNYGIRAPVIGADVKLMWLFPSEIQYKFLELYTLVKGYA